MSDLDGSKIEQMHNRVLKRVESTDNRVKDHKRDVSNLTQTIRSHSASIKHLETQMNHMYGQINPRAKGTLPSDTLPKPKNDGNLWQ